MGVAGLDRSALKEWPQHNTVKCCLVAFQKCLKGMATAQHSEVLSCLVAFQELHESRRAAAAQEAAAKQAEKEGEKVSSSEPSRHLQLHTPLTLAYLGWTLQSPTSVCLDVSVFHISGS